MGCAESSKEDPAHPTHTYYEVRCVGGVLLSHNPTIAVPSAQSNLATGIGTGPGVPLTLKPPTQTLETNHPHTPANLSGVQASVLCQTLYNKHKHDNNILFFFCGNTSFLAQSIPLNFLLPTHTLGVFCVGVLVPVTYNTSPCSQPWPINPIISREPQQKPHLTTGFPLRCFQRLSLPHVANQPCHWRNNWHTRGTSIPVLSY